MTSRTRKKLRVNTKNKSYALNQCALYKCPSKKRLALILGTDGAQVRQLLSRSDNYRIFQLNNPYTAKEREIQQPIGLLALLHNRIASLLSRVSPPDYLHSGIKGRSNISNASAHIRGERAITMDISAFFPSTTRRQIDGFFYNQLSCAPDVAGILATICSFNGHLPTGSQISMPLAYWANVDMFTALHTLAEKKGVEMTVYVDDITFSGRQADKGFSHTASRIIQRSGHRVNAGKTRHYNETQAKLITGVIVERGQLKVRNLHHQRIHESYIGYLNGTPAEQSFLMPSLKGKLYAAAAIDPSFKRLAKTIQ